MGSMARLAAFPRGLAPLLVAFAVSVGLLAPVWASDCCHVPGHCEWRGSNVVLDNVYCCPNGGHAASAGGSEDRTTYSALQLGAGVDVRPTIEANHDFDTYTCKCTDLATTAVPQACSHTPPPKGHFTMLPTT